MTHIAPSQLLSRQLKYFNNKHLLIAGEIEDDFPLTLAQHAESVSVFSTNFAMYQSLKQHEILDCQFGAKYETNTAKDMLLLYWPKAKAEAEFLLAMLLPQLTDNAEIVVVGETRSGVKGIEKIFQPYGKITKFDSARRCSFYWGACLETIPAFSIDDWLSNYTIKITNEKITICALPGVFSRKELDLATQLLLDNITKIDGNVLDVGCGSGVIGAVLKKRNPTINIDMVDISALAIYSAKKTLEANLISGEVYATDGYSEIKKSYHHIISNPPFHAGLQTHYATTETLLTEAPKYLKKAGTLTIVANNFLRYPPFIQQSFGHCHLIVKNKQFSVYQAKKIV